MRRATVALRGPGSLYRLEEVLDETGRRRGAREGARGLRRDQGREPRRRDALRRHRARDRARRDRAQALRGRRAQPARVPHLGRPRGRAARADPGAGAALAQPRAAQGGGGGAREPRRHRLAPQAPAADPRPAQARAAERARRMRLRGPHPRHPRLPEAGDRVQGHHARCSSTPRRCGPRSTRWPSTRATWRWTTWCRPRRAASCSGGAVAAAAGAGFILARKPGKLPRETASVEYELEYGVDALEVHARRRARRRPRAGARRPAGHGRHRRRAVRPGRAARAASWQDARS